jgi:uncharacterized iron-regulated membrane protein
MTLLANRSVVRLHRWLSLSILVFWLLQALTGMLLVFRWELDDLALSGGRVAVHPGKLGAAIDAIGQQRGRVSQMWASSQASERFDVYFTGPNGGDYVVRVDGSGRVLRERSTDSRWGNGAFYDSLTTFHTTLFVGDRGRWIVALTGVFLLSNLVLGVKLAWPRAGRWANTLLTRPPGSSAARLRGWHLRVGLWGSVPMAAMLLAGILLCFKDELVSLAGELPPPQPVRSQSFIGSARALQVATQRYPGAKLSALKMPSDDAAWYLVRLHAADEISRNWGNTLVYVDASSGEILSDQPASAQPVFRRFVEFIYPFHTGQFLAVAGRVVALVGAFWLIAMSVMGFSMWRRRSRASVSTQEAARKPAAATTSEA